METKRIYAVVPNAGTIASPNKSRIWKLNLCAPLLKLGHDVVSLDVDYDQFFVHAENVAWLSKNRAGFSDAVWSGFLRAHQSRPVHLCFFYLCDGFIDHSVIDRIRAQGVPVFNYSCNNIHQFHLIKDISKAVDCNVYAEFHAREKFARHGVPAVQMQMAANPDFYRPYQTPWRYDATFVGQRYADRGELLGRLISAGINVHAFGPRWQPDSRVGNTSFMDRLDKLFSIARQRGAIYAGNYIFHKIRKTLRDQNDDVVLAGHTGGILDDDSMVELFSASKVNLGFATVYAGGREGGSEMYHLRLRDFEIPMAGGFYLTRYTEELDDYFKVGKEIECYRDTDELVDKCHYYVTHDQQRELIRSAGLARSRACHTWEERFTRLFSDPLIAPLVR